MSQLFSALSFLVAFLCVELAIRLLLSNFGERTYRSFFVLASLIGSYGIFYGIITITEDAGAVAILYRFSSLTWCAIPSAVYIFINRFISRMKDERFRRRHYVVYLPSAVFVAAGISGRLLAQGFERVPAGWKESGFYGTFYDFAFISFLSVITAVSVARMVLMYRTLKKEKKRRLSRRITAFTLTAFLLTAFSNLVLNAFDWIKLPPFGHLLQGVFVVGIGVFMLNERFLRFSPQLLADDVFRMMTDIAAVADTEKRVLQISRAGIDFWGIRESRIGRNPAQGMSLDDLRIGPHALPEPGGSAEGIIELTDKKGKKVPYRFTTKSIIDYFGDPQGFFFIATSAEELMKLEHMNTKLKVMSETDSLTQLFNRRKAERVLSREIVKSKRYSHTFSLIMFDLDDFKKINDVCGHNVGDGVLVEAAGRIKAEIREIDSPCRWGGEEFLVICPESDLQGAVTLAERLRESIGKEIPGCPRIVTASFGVAEFSGSEDSETLVQRADEMLYKAKEAGKNTVKA